MSPLGASPSDFVRVRELDLAIKFLSDKIDSGFKVSHELQRQTNGRLLRAEQDIQALKLASASDDAVEAERAKDKARWTTFQVAALSCLGSAGFGGVAYLVKRAFGL